MKDPTFKRAKPEHEVAFQAIIDLLRQHGDKVDGMEMVLIAGPICWAN